MNHLGQYGLTSRYTSTTLKCLIGDNELGCSIIKIMNAIYVQVDERDIEAGHRIGKSKGNSKKTVVRFHPQIQ